MSEIESSNPIPPNPNQMIIYQQINRSTMRFLNALETYDRVEDEGQKKELKNLMDAQMEVIRSNIQQLKEKQWYEQGQKLNSDYSAYLQNPNEPHLEALERDIAEIRDYNSFSEGS